MIAPRRLARLLILLPSTRFGGTERHTAELAARLTARTGIAVDLAAEPALHSGLGERPGVTLRAAALGWEGAPAGQQAAETARLLAELRPDAAFVPLPWPDAASGILPALAAAGLPRLVLLHLAPEAPAPEAPPALGLERAMIAAVSAPLTRRAERAWGLEPGTVALLPNPAPPPPVMERQAARARLRDALGLPPDAKLLLFVGRLEEAKGADLLPDISDRLPATLACAGDGPLRGLLESRAMGDPRGLLRMLGPVADPAPWYLAADALLLPSRLEGAPLVFLEAAAHRCPVVATPDALEALGEAAPAMACLATSPDGRGMAEAAGAVLDDPRRFDGMLARAAALAARQDWAKTVETALGLLRAAVLRAEESAG
ncbi:glycosyltransferase family 4 protein [Falsiroseomonas sp.]|uniref:glycosyltransferase family 4 protein n=1 Tax=Falsiroseomonas sp. TaxID=2870721 RepID=UPI00356262BB